MFIRGLDPKVAMNIGTTTWENIQSGHVLYVKKFVRIHESLFPPKRTFARDGAKSDNIGISKTYYLCIQEINKSLKNKIIFLNIKFYLSQYKEIFSDTTRFAAFNSLSGPLEQFKKHFDIVQRLKL